MELLVEVEDESFEIVKENHQLLKAIVEIEDESFEIVKENHQLLKAIDWKLWEILKIANAFARAQNLRAQNLDVTEPFPVDNDKD